MGAKHTYETNFVFVRCTSAYLGFKHRSELLVSPEKLEAALLRTIYFKHGILEFPNNRTSRTIHLTTYKKNKPGETLKIKI